MTSVWVGSLALVAIAGFMLARRWLASTVAERSSRPRQLKDAELVFMEQQFRISHPIRLVARLDRAYRLTGGTLVLVELKARRNDRPYETDIIQLSAQKLAIEGQADEVVEPYAFVSILRPTGSRSLRHHQVALLDAGEIVELRHRRDAILAGHTAPRYARSSKTCNRCAFRSQCDRPHG